MMEDFPRLVFSYEEAGVHRGQRQWRFRPKDIIILSTIALMVSGLMGLGTIMVVDLFDRFILS